MSTAAQTEPLASCEPTPPLPRMTYEESLDWAGEDTVAERVDREVLLVSPAGDRHQDLVRFFTSVLGVYVVQRHLGVGCPAPFQMKLARGREPDVLFVAQVHLERLTPTHLEGPADVVVEVMSTTPRDRALDRGEEFFEYEQGGVREYWLADPVRNEAEFYRLDERGSTTWCPPRRTAFSAANL